MKNNRGLSGIVTTLIIILLVLVAVGVIWGVVNNLLDRSTGTISTTTKCLDIDVRATKVIESETNPGVYNVTLTRKPTGGDEEFGAMMVMFNDVTNTEAVEFDGTLGPLDVKTREFDTTLSDVTTVTNGTKIQITPFFRDDSGQRMLCTTSTEFEFA